MKKIIIFLSLFLLSSCIGSQIKTESSVSTSTDIYQKVGTESNSIEHIGILDNYSKIYKVTIDSIQYIAIVHSGGVAIVKHKDISDDK